MDSKKNLGLIKKIDFILDRKDLSDASKEILKLSLNEIGAEGGGIFIHDPLKNKLLPLAKKGRLNNILINRCFNNGEKIFEKKYIVLPIRVHKKRLGVIYFYGSRFTQEDYKFLIDIESFLDGRFNHKYNSLNLKYLFSRYVGENIMKKILFNQKKKSYVKKQDCSILFADLNGFTELTNKIPPKKIFSMLNTFFEILVSVALKMNGTISQIIGDEIMVVFGSPTIQKDHSRRAIKCAKLMRSKIKSFFKKQPLIKGISIGIASGKIIAGNIGHEQFMRYAFIGPKVNLASRLTSLAGKNQILIDEETKKNSFKFSSKYFGKKKIKGFSRSISIYEII